MAKTEIRVDSVDKFFARGRKHARLADQKRPIPSRRVVAFENVESLLRVLTAKRVLLLREVKEQPASIATLAQKLKRDRSAVTRDVQLLERLGVLEVTDKPLPGHGRQKWITSLAREIELVATL